MYKRFACDHDIALRANRSGEMQLLSDCVIEHKNPSNGTRPPWDIGNIKESETAEDRRIFFNVRSPAILSGKDLVTW